MHKNKNYTSNQKNLEEYNSLLTLRELKDSIKKMSHNSAVGPDEINYEFLKKLLEESLKFLLKIFNKI